MLDQKTPKMSCFLRGSGQGRFVSGSIIIRGFTVLQDDIGRGVDLKGSIMGAGT
jgi:hypothetical protein